MIDAASIQQSHLLVHRFQISCARGQMQVRAKASVEQMMKSLAVVVLSSYMVKTSREASACTLKIRGDKPLHW